MTMGHCHITTLPCITPPKPYFRLTGGVRAKVKRCAVGAVKKKIEFEKCIAKLAKIHPSFVHSDL